MGSPESDLDAWVAVAGTVPVDAVDLVSGRLWVAGAAGVEERAAPDEAAPVELVASGPAERAASLQAAFPDGTEVRMSALGLGGEVVDPWATGVRDVVVTAELTVSIDPGGAFGHGGHITTRLAMQAMVEVVGLGVSVLDVGSGSGVLAVAAARLGAATVVAVDVDARAREATAANADVNGVAVAVEAGGIDAVEGAFDVVVANLEAPVLLELAPAIVDRVAPGGVAVVAGFLAARAGEITTALAPLTVVARRDEADWTALTVQRAP